MSADPGHLPDPERTRRMIAELGHRGPDEHGLLLWPGACLGHARLSIIDIEGGHQPMANEDGTVHVVFNGEIFNFVELRAELTRAGHRFRTRCDTEVIVHLYEEHGIDFVHRLNGEFAIALWDAPRARCVLARDRVGIRPLHYAHAPGEVLFASEAKALFASGAVAAALDPFGIAQSLTFWAPLAPRTAFRNVHALPPGHLAVVQAGRVDVRRYWDWPFDPDADSRCPAPGEVQEEMDALLCDAVRIRLRADVPVAAYLSGGLDSSLVTALAQEMGASALQAFGLRFSRADLDEGEHQAVVARALGVDLHAVWCDPGVVGEAFPATVRHVEAPVVRTAPAAMYVLARHVHGSGYKVVLTGEGADEVFAGYDIFKEARVRRFWGRHHGSQARARLLSRLYPWMATSPTAVSAYARQFFGHGLDDPHAAFFAHLPRWRTTQRSWRFLSPELTAELRGWDPVAELAETLPADYPRWQPLQRDQYVEARTLMSSYLLAAQGDRVAMAHSVEARLPYLDHRVIEFAGRLPNRMKMAGLRDKLPLRKVAAGRLPARAAQRPKQPFRATDSESFFRGGVALDYVREALDAARLKGAGCFDPSAVDMLVRKCAQGRAIGFADNMSFVGILSTMLLHQTFVERGGRAVETAPAERRAAS